MKKINFLIIAAMLFLAACTPKNQIVIKGDILGLDSEQLFLAVRENKIWVKLDSCTVKNGKFQLKCIVDEPRLAFLMDFQTPAFRLPVLIEPGKITVTGNMSDHNIIIKGSKLHDEYHAIMEQSEALDKECEEQLAIYNAAQESGDLMGMAPARFQLNEIENQQDNLKIDYIKEHPQSLVSLVFITSELIHYASLQELETYKSWIDPSLYGTKAMKEIDLKIATLQKFEPGQTISDIALPDTDGVVQTLSDLRGKYVLVEFWASWCRDCRIENPEVVAVYKEFHDKGFEIFAVSLDREKEAWLGAIEKDNLTWIHVSELKGWNGEVSQKFSVSSIPSNLLIDTEGKIIARNVFGSELHRIVDEIMSQLK
jgi:peroxiredoxin